MPLTRQHWDDLLVSKDADTLLENLQQDGTLAATFPEVQAMVGFGGGDSGHKDLWGHTKKVVIQCVPRLNVRWAALFHDVGKPQAFRRVGGEICFHHHEAVSTRLFEQAMDRTGLFAKDPQVALGISFLIRNVGFVEAYESSWTDSAVRRLGKDLGVYVQDTLALSRGDITTANDGKRKRFLAQVSELEHRIEDLAKQDAIPPALPKGLGDALGARLGLPPGRELGEVMKALKARVEAGELPRNAAIEVYLPHASLPPTRMHPQEVTSESIPWPKDAIEKAL